jgi:hypothetical protein
MTDFPEIERRHAVGHAIDFLERNMLGDGAWGGEDGD